MDLQAVIKRSCLIVASLLLFSGCEQEEIEIGFLGIANVDHFLAASRLTEKLGIPSQSYRRLEAIPPPEGSMIFLPATAIRNERTMNELRNWIDYGGTAVFMLTVQEEADYWREDKLDETPVEKFLDSEGIELKKPEYKDEQVDELFFDSGEQFQEIYDTDFKNYINFRYADGGAGSDEDYFQFDGYEYGDGYIHVISTGVMFTNKYLNKAQHATLLWDMIDYHSPNEVQFIYSNLSPSFLQLIWKYFPYATISLAFLLTIWIWYSAKRFGPLFQTINLSQNKLDDHLTATGYFFTKHKADGVIIYDVQNELRTSLARRVNLPINADYGEILSTCQTQGILSPEEVSILRQPLPENAKERIAYLQQLQKIKP